MKIGIVIPLKSKKVSKDWSLTCYNLLRTLNSIANQSNANFRAVIVGHDEPEFFKNSTYKTKKIIYSELEELPPPIETTSTSANQLLYEKDRCTKILKGIRLLRELDIGIDYWFPLDADDLIHRDFVKEISSLNVNNDLDAIILNRGYIFYNSKWVFNRENNFSLYCGSSAIIHDNLIPKKLKITHESYQNFLFGEIPHTNMYNKLIQKKLKVIVPKKRLILYCKDNGENISDFTSPNRIFYSLKRALKIKAKKIYFNKNLMSDFALKNDMSEPYLASNPE